MANISSSNSQGVHVPKLRFPGFEGEWIVKPLSSFLVESKIAGSDGKNAKKLSVKLWAKGVVEKNTVFEGSENTQYYIRKAGQLMYGKLDFLNCAFGIVPPELDGYESTFDAPAFDISNIDSTFLLNRIIQRDFYKKNGDIANGSRKAKRIHPDTFLAMEIATPTLAEQAKIANFIISLDERIEKQQQLVEALKSYKRGALSKLFPQKGETVPKYRFAGFTEPWEQRKLGELSEKTYGGGTPSTSNPDYWKGDIAWLQSSDIADGKLFDVVPKKFISLAGLSNSAAQLVPGNSIAIITRVGVGKLAFLPFSYTTSQDFLSMSRLKAEPFFTVYACYKKLQSELNAVQGTSIKGITKDELLAKEIMVPKYDEQKQIGDFFKRLDNLITLHQRKLGEFQALKLGLLQQLFI